MLKHCITQNTEPRQFRNFIKARDSHWQEILPNVTGPLDSCSVLDIYTPFLIFTPLLAGRHDRGLSKMRQDEAWDSYGVTVVWHGVDTNAQTLAQDLHSELETML